MIHVRINRTLKVWKYELKNWETSRKICALPVAERMLLVLLPCVQKVFFVAESRKSFSTLCNKILLKNDVTRSHRAMQQCCQISCIVQYPSLLKSLWYPSLPPWKSISLYLIFLSHTRRLIALREMHPSFQWEDTVHTAWFL